MIVLASLPGLFLVIMLTLTLVLLPYISDERKAEPRRATEEIHIRRGGKGQK